MELPPKPKNILNSKLAYYTENVFEQELYTGSANIVHHDGEKYKEQIIMDNLSEYQKHLQEQFPQMPAEWSENKKDQNQQQVPPGLKKVCKGLRRWTALPTLTDYATEKGPRPPDYGLLHKPLKKSFNTHEDRQVMRNMVTEWIKAWRMYSHWQDATLEELESDLKAMHSHVQLNALATCASGAIEHPKLEERDVSDRWIAAQSLALTGDDSYPVISRIILHLFETPDTQTAKQVCLILGPLSEKTDVTHKIVYLMWNDWNSSVRQAAAQSLGVWGLGKKVHDELRERLDKGDSRIRIEALSCIGLLGVMTGKLMPSFLDCFKDDFVGVRKEACLTAGLLKLKDEKVLHQLLRLMQSDHIWKVKAYAIKALGAIGYVTEELKDLLLWALHYENEPGIRMEACNTIVSLNLQDAKVQSVLRQRLLVESDLLVWKDVKLALLRLGGSAEVEEGILQKIKEQLPLTRTGQQSLLSVPATSTEITCSIPGHLDRTQ
ncbi:HEAT repeat-containing protein 4 [Hemitrygon akajei]|uniref:HEAT repeat-containing protein 4 n=1 Tax=Hemitrygon akajei TaxID=2704970 RepID=UPI003BF9D4F6